MGRFFKVILVVLTVSFSAILIGRSCHDDTGDYDPNRSGGIAQAIRQSEKEGNTASSPTARRLERLESKEFSRIERNAPPATGAAAGERVSAPPAGTPQAYAYSEAPANQQLQGTWVLTDGKTRLQLTVVHNRGFLEGHISEGEKSVEVEQIARIIDRNGTAYVYGFSAASGGASASDAITLTFNFNQDGTTQVVMRRGDRDQSTHLTVESHTKR